jgi:hypothetical protein
MDEMTFQESVHKFAAVLFDPSSTWEQIYAAQDKHFHLRAKLCIQRGHPERVEKKWKT